MKKLVFLFLAVMMLTACGQDKENDQGAIYVYIENDIAFLTIYDLLGFLCCDVHIYRPLVIFFILPTGSEHHHRQKQNNQLLHGITSFALSNLFPDIPTLSVQHFGFFALSFR